ncbi:hypothetical protein ABGV42_00855 [Paenibacillus pabuli]|uniref:hypothetical protein n=1 Tax=Paenibacillus pabuli TaxID=1472 RepID=UPI0032421D33
MINYVHKRAVYDYFCNAWTDRQKLNFRFTTYEGTDVFDEYITHVGYVDDTLVMTTTRENIEINLKSVISIMQSTGNLVLTFDSGEIVVNHNYM